MFLIVRVQITLYKKSQTLKYFGEEAVPQKFYQKLVQNWIIVWNFFAQGDVHKNFGVKFKGSHFEFLSKMLLGETLCKLI